jgi:prolyl-tRNA synthetase
MAAVVECWHDESGMVWPIAVAPFEAVVTVINPKNATASDAGGAIYDALVAEGIDVLLDDRDERPGVKFNDAELIGIPYRITVGPKGLAEGIVEVTRRRGSQSRNVAVEKAAASVAEAILEERAFSPGI